ncbi:hypothetical protein AXG93_1293s1090 [Marchantia polymorpha subsp. ruderalis]|uniref:Uncharacterized protein n=1 Tax=Marchantia polymorpha subsp. ruderalis TaxID=1480154 RepID=A0A176WFW2_MARPO|nr:hypothetical protein AXG93_1293s1090 [Marchantia polymorpha subsp. ruderalis]
MNKLNFAVFAEDTAIAPSNMTGSKGQRSKGLRPKANLWRPGPNGWFLLRGSAFGKSFLVKGSSADKKEHQKRQDALTSVNAFGDRPSVDDIRLWRNAFGDAQRVNRKPAGTKSFAATPSTMREQG